jgi:hypothetical protein
MGTIPDLSKTGNCKLLIELIWRPGNEKKEIISDYFKYDDNDINLDS